uniref:NADH-ubiquinone oxidoreductase chain 3 n=1 Tax=Carios mexicanus TaxID=34600 RepID=W0FDH3_CARMN|nr:NADH dehydrogenase subunit 3 [Antricola mexicanus]AHF21658.1 NADH dehydrogenase subunit 3 [Antricola mexicanus]
MSLMITSVLITAIVMIMGSMIKKKNFFMKEKNTPFECGFDPFSLNRQPFSLRFFMISIIFLIFDIEIIIILPFPLFTYLNDTFHMIMIMTIIMIILLGLIYEWKNGMIQWI